MAVNEHCLYSASHIIPVFDSKSCENRKINVNVLDSEDKLEIKLRDLSEYSFNYEEFIDLGDFEVLRLKQSLDVDYAEFKTNVIEMLQQFERKEMLLKCERADTKTCTLVFYAKSKIKNIIYLTIDLHLTNPQQIIKEMHMEINDLQAVISKFKRQLVKNQDMMNEKNEKLTSLQGNVQALIQQICKEVHKIDTAFTTNLLQAEQVIHHNLTSKMEKLMMVEDRVDILIQENRLKVDSNNRLLKTMESLRLENNENFKTIEKQHKEINSLDILRVTLERNIANLKQLLEESQNHCSTLEKAKEEMQQDLQQLSVTLAEKDSKLNEISKDLIQANNMLVQFNNRFDNKVQEFEELQHAFSDREKLLSEQKIKTTQVLSNFAEYRAKFNEDSFDYLNAELKRSYQKVQGLEEELRKVNKINAILTKKVSSTAGIISS